jgi:hypothetical protein
MCAAARANLVQGFRKLEDYFKIFIFRGFPISVNRQLNVYNYQVLVTLLFVSYAVGCECLSHYFTLC